jgi:hypothetical protein
MTWSTGGFVTINNNTYSLRASDDHDMVSGQLTSNRPDYILAEGRRQLTGASIINRLDHLHTGV